MAWLDTNWRSKVNDESGLSLAVEAALFVLLILAAVVLVPGLLGPAPVVPR